MSMPQPSPPLTTSSFGDIPASPKNNVSRFAHSQSTSSQKERQGTPKPRRSQADKDAPITLTTPDGRVMEKPKRLRTAYNIFFKHHRELLLQSLPVRKKKPRNSHGKIGFTTLAQTIAARWKNITDEEKAYFQNLADQDRDRYKREMKVWKELEKASHLQQQMNTMPPHPQSNLCAMNYSAPIKEEAHDFDPIPVCTFAPSPPASEGFVAAQDQFYTMDPVPAYSLQQEHHQQYAMHNAEMQYGSSAGQYHSGSLERLANSLGPDCVTAFIKAFRN